MSREAFQAPSIPTGGQSSAFAPTQTTDFGDTSKPVAYLCGDCDTKVFLKRGDPIRCKECEMR
ncbi:DNA-directed RNA polymerase I, II, and III subunit RPABC4 [Elsinoe australis]|uniref:DNA-directed RNA polymerase I, II, and III subunit RPABC4 n=1 Tax=Elsinoe australis TaxID=40998 RepID=A0A2P7ZAT3_9PEZI|nr:DNA-directed RNA polymerase I, II, and III subunit RPABC4 [Elsinoe australis]